MRWGTGTITLTNSILWGNGDDVNGDPLGFAVTFSDIGDGDFPDGDHNISADPLFMAPGAGDYRLAVVSPCIDAGRSDGMPTLDIRGWPRWDEPSVPNTGRGEWSRYFDMGPYEYSPDSDSDGLPDSVETGTGVYRGPDDTGTEPTEEDSDSDGLDDGAEVLVHGTDPTNPDSDGDGKLDGDEIAAGTDPLDPRSFFAVISIVRDETNAAWMSITWTGAGGKSYAIYWTDGLPGDARVWDAVDGPALDDIVDNGDGTWTWTDKGTDPDMGGQAPGDVGQRLYRVAVESP